MSHVGLGSLDEPSAMLLFGNSHSRLLTRGLPHNLNEVVDAKGRQLYPAYFMTDLTVPLATPLRAFSLWQSVQIETTLSRFGETLLESSYSLWRMTDEGVAITGDQAAITMRANSVFIVDPSLFLTKHKQVSAPRYGMIAPMRRLSSPPLAIQESVHLRAGLADDAHFPHRAATFSYHVESGRDVVPGHPLMFAKIPQIIEISERRALRDLSDARMSEEMLDAVDLLRRKTFYFNNAFAGADLRMYTQLSLRPCEGSQWQFNSKVDYVACISFSTEVYVGGELLAMARAEKVSAFLLGQQAMAQDARRLYRQLLSIPK